MGPKKADEPEMKCQRVGLTSRVVHENAFKDPISSVVPDNSERMIARVQLHYVEPFCYIYPAEFQSLLNAQASDEFLVSSNGVCFPYAQDEVQALFIRKCYSEVFDILISRLATGRKRTAISGTPGIGKSHFFMYLLYRFFKEKKNLLYCPKRIIYHYGGIYHVFELESNIVCEFSNRPALFLNDEETLYILDGQFSGEIVATCSILFIASPGSEGFRHVTTKGRIEVLYFPVWTWEEIERCRQLCYSSLSEQCVRERFLMLGGNAHFVFDLCPESSAHAVLEPALSDVDITTAMECVGYVTEKYKSTHMLFHIIVDENYKKIFLDFASPYVGLRLMEKHFV